MSNNTERITFRLPATTKHSVNQIPEDNSKWIRDLVERELDRRELMKDEKKKEAPDKVERAKELSTEIGSLEDELSRNQARLQELQKTVNGLQEELNKKRSLKESIVEEIESETEMDKVMVKGLVGDV